MSELEHVTEIFEYRQIKGYRFDIPIKRRRPVQIAVAGLPDIETDYISIRGGQMIIAGGYAWDGATGWPKWLKHPKSLIRSSMAHDALYQLMREGEVDREKWRDYADRLLQQISVADGANKTLAKMVYRLTRRLGKKYTMPQKDPRGKIRTITTGS